jgi:hypothetical protein
VLHHSQNGVGHAVHLGQETFGDNGDSHVPHGRTRFSVTGDDRVTPWPTMPELSAGDPL